MGFDTRCNITMLYLNRETEIANKCGSIFTGVLSARPLCSSAHLFISNRNSRFKPRRTACLCLCEIVFTLRSCSWAVRIKLHSPQCQTGRHHLIFSNGLQTM